MTNSIIHMRPTALIELLKDTITYNVNAKPNDQAVILIASPPGIGKTSMVSQVAEEKNLVLHKSHPSVEDPTDVKGIPWPDKENNTANFLPLGVMAKVMNEEYQCIWLLDDFGQAPQSVQVAYMQLLLGKEIAGHKLPHHANIVICTNRVEDQAAVVPIPEPVKSRTTIINLQFNIDDWCLWAIQSDLPYEFVAFAKYRAQLFDAYKPTRELKNQLTPRTLAAAANRYKAGLPKHLWQPVFAGQIGEGAGAELDAFLRVFADLPDPHAILLDPTSARVPEGVDGKYAVTMALLKHVQPQTLENAFVYLGRLKDNNGMQSKEYEFMFGKMLTNTPQAKSCINTNAFQKWAIENQKYFK